MYKILINALVLTGQYSGVNYTTAYLLDAIGRLDLHDYHITVLVSRDYAGDFPVNKHLELKKAPIDCKSRTARIGYENFILPFFLKRNGYQLYHSTAYVLPFFCRTPAIVTLHDLIALDHPGLCKNSTAIYFGLCVPAAVRKAAKIIVVSDTVKNDILRTFNRIRPEKIETIYHGLSSRFRPIKDMGHLAACREKYSLPNKYLLFVGNIEPKKNIIGLLRAFQKLISDYGLEHTLVIVGKKGWKYSAVFRYIKQAGLANRIIFTGYADDRDIPALYSLADVCLFPSLYEGFGLPVIEAMACGCPVVVSDRGALPEISSGITPPLSPDDFAGIAAQTYRLVADLAYRRAVIEKGLRHSRQFSWDKAAQQTVGIYKDLLSVKDL